MLPGTLKVRVQSAASPGEPGSSGRYLNRSPGWHFRISQMRSSVSKRMPFTLPDFSSDRLDLRNADQLRQLARLHLAFRKQHVEPYNASHGASDKALVFFRDAGGFHQRPRNQHRTIPPGPRRPAPPKTTWYVGGDLGMSREKLTTNRAGWSGKSSGNAARGGYQFSRYFAVEGGCPVSGKSKRPRAAGRTSSHQARCRPTGSAICR